MTTFKKVQFDVHTTTRLVGISLHEDHDGSRVYQFLQSLVQDLNESETNVQYWVNIYNYTVIEVWYIYVRTTHRLKWNFYLFNNAGYHCKSISNYMCQ